MASKLNLNPDQILELEYNYTQTSANQSIEDRHKIINFYVAIGTAVGSVSVGILGMQSSFSSGLLLGLSSLSLMVAVVGWLFLAMMIRLRQAWVESMVAMNRIKDYYLENHVDLKRAFLWSGKTLPKANKMWTLHFYSTLLIIVIDSLAMGLSVGLMLAASGWTEANAIAWALAASIVSIFTQGAIYRMVLSRR